MVYMGLSILGGLWFPTATMSTVMQNIAKFTPTYWLGQGAWNLVGGGAIEWSGAFILAAYVIVFMVLSTYIMKRQEAI
jgi:ABC-2 type transport system permease protein